MAQEHKYTVYFDSGSGTLVYKETVKDLTEGMVVYDGQVIKLKENHYVLIFSEDGTPVLLDKKGTYSYEDIRNKEKLAKQSLTASFFKYLWENIVKSKSVELNNAQGGVYRADILMKIPPDSCLVLNDTVTLKWNTLSATQSVYILFFNSKGDKIYSYKTIGSSFLINRGSNIIFSEPDIKWLVSLSPDPDKNSVKYLFTFASDEQKEILTADLQKFKKGLVYNDELNRLLLATYFGNHHLYLDAINEYKVLMSKYRNNDFIIKQDSIFKKLHNLY